jgi:putative methionine-R-sulfoxide reductase with GAF domain
MHGSAQPENPFPPAGSDAAVNANQSSSAGDSSAGESAVGAIGAKSGRSGALEEGELDTALQLLVERAQYITGATGAALALPQGEEMVCRASTGESAPAVGARLQVRSGLTGESISRKQLLCCNNAETDPRVNLEACRALGIASIVVLPLLRGTGEVRGLFELFSDHPYAFEERDLIALERMAGLTATALDLAEQRQNAVPAPMAVRDVEDSIQLAPTKEAAAIPAEGAVIPAPESPATAVVPTVMPVEPVEISPSSSPSSSSSPSCSSLYSSPLLPSTASLPEPAPVALIPDAMLRVQKCASCGFPVSEGRTLCLDCEKKDSEKKDFEKKQGAREQAQAQEKQQKSKDPEDAAGVSGAGSEKEFVPEFLANAAPAEQSWLANHVNLLAIAVLVMGILVAVVVFR